ncbi:ejaculatory bulb-specific protein 3-like [Diabrotica virgifera virgifera]|uniref:Ejaculatory bulb-specific protein 3-like n=1 Tax=Diabrotica virgifera virgifera TaxID=50390 RepID=A0ABM5ITK7_DIAVI|nr:ejaculatory bulb-specific protein 3-like [Diabrotica virgifera virgifera]
MQISIFFLFVLVGVSFCEKYSTKYDNIDLDEILKSDRLLNNYINCIMDKGTCTADGKELKDNLADALKTNCSKCSEKQNNGSKKVIKFLVKNKKPTFDEVAAKYDPENKYINEHREELAKDGIIV